jgi:hypothetical protein
MALLWGADARAGPRREESTMPKGVATHPIDQSAKQLSGTAIFPDRIRLKPVRCPGERMRKLSVVELS